MMVITGGAGFIGYNILKSLIDVVDIIVVDRHKHNLTEEDLSKIMFFSPEDFMLWSEFNHHLIDGIYHLGARTDTMETNINLFDELNLNYSKFIWYFCVKYQKPLLYASSAATYGDGRYGFDDYNYDLEPLNRYGQSKHDFDLYVLGSETFPPFWAGFKFFNVYGNYEQHKGKMSSVIWHLYNQIKNSGKVKLFKSHIDWCVDGEQKRDFIHVDDIVNTLNLFMGSSDILNIKSGIYNLGTGVARSYNDLAKIIFKNLDIDENISYIDTPIEIRDSYQYYTCAKMTKLFNIISEHIEFSSLEDGVELYIEDLENENC